MRQGLLLLALAVSTAAAAASPDTAGDHKVADQKAQRDQTQGNERPAPPHSVRKTGTNDGPPTRGFRLPSYKNGPRPADICQPGAVHQTGGDCAGDSSPLRQGSEARY